VKDSDFFFQLHFGPGVLIMPDRYRSFAPISDGFNICVHE